VFTEGKKTLRENIGLHKSALPMWICWPSASSQNRLDDCRLGRLLISNMGRRRKKRRKRRRGRRRKIK
jgi:hypothetical protein